MNIVNFTPRPSATVGFAATSTTGAKKICGDAVIDLLIYNKGASDAYVEIGNSSVTATAPTTSANGSAPLPPGSIQVMRGVRADNTGIYAAVICDSGNTATVLITPGNGS